MAQPKLDVFQVIADPSRRHMMILLSGKSLTINALAENFDMSRPAVSKHVRIMHEAGFISIEDVGRERYCTLKPDGFKELQQWISYFDKFWAAKLANYRASLTKKQNNKMEQHDYHRSVAANMTPQEAYEKIADVSGWWAKDFKGSALKNGDTFTVRFGTTWVDFKITDAIPGQKTTWQVIDCNLPWLSDIKEWNNTRVAWDIRPGNDGCRIEMTHHGLRPGVECWNACEKGWDGHLLGSLHNLVNGGVGKPE